MTLALASIPDDIDHLRGWLEAHLVSGELRSLAAELASVHRADPPPDTVRDRLGRLLPDVLFNGLSALPAEELRHLLIQPYHLLELQEIVLVEGGPYWNSVSQSRELVERARADRERIGWKLFGRGVAPLETPTPAPPRFQRTRRIRARWIIATTAATVFVATFFGTRYFDSRPHSEAAWGWKKAAAFPDTLSRADYLNLLAEEANEWFNKRPETVPAVAKRIIEFREGCTAMLLAEHSPLAPVERLWLRDRCRVWRDELDKALSALEDTRDIAAALAATDALVNRLVEGLRRRAATG